MECPFVEKYDCPYALKTLPLDEKLREEKNYPGNYCLSKDYGKCARYTVCTTLGKPNVPKDLLPDHFPIAEMLIKDLKPSETYEDII